MTSKIDISEIAGHKAGAENPLYISLILPAYNEVKRIGQTIAEAKFYFEQRSLSYEIIVAADGDDGTRELVAKMAQDDSTLKVIGSVERRGKGYGIRQAVKLARGQIIGFSDADNKTPIEEFAKLEAALLNGYDMAIGSRGLRQSLIERSQPLYRQVGSRGFGVLVHTVLGLPGIIDTQCGFKFFKREVALDLFTRQVIDGYMFDVEILYLAQQTGYRLIEVPIRWRDDGDSRLVLLSGNIRNGLDVFRIRFRKKNYLPVPAAVALQSEVEEI
jgi:dolichyl-phosphate beta-glucosyltransferase